MASFLFRTASMQATAAPSHSEPVFDPIESMPPAASAVPTDGATLGDHNPGAYDELHRKCKDIFPLCFDGAKLMVSKGLSSRFQLQHNVSISSLNTGYRFGATYVGTKLYGPNEAFPVMLGDTDLNGNTSATIIHQWGNRWRAKFQSQIQNSKFGAAQGTLDYRGRLSTTSLTLASIDLVNESGIAVAQYLRRVHPRLDVGTEMVYQYGRSGEISVLSYAARYMADHWQASGTFGRSGVHLCYYHRQAENLAFGVEWETNFRVNESVATFGYQVEIPEAGVKLNASLDTNYTVQGVFEKRLSQSLPFSLAISGMINHVKAQGRFGVGLIIGG